MFCEDKLDFARWNTLKKSIFEDPEICLDRAKLITKSYKETESLPQIIRVAKAFEKVLKEMKIYIQSKELLVGNLASKPMAAPIYPEFGVTFIERELNEFEKRPFDRFIVSEEVKNGLKDIIQYWKGKAREDKVVELASLVLPEEVKKAWDPKAFDLNQIVHAGSKKADGDGHLEPGHEKPLKIGFKGIIKEAKEALSKIDFRDKDAVNKSLFLKAVIICYEAVIDFIKRYEKLAQQLAPKEKNPDRKKELEEISNACSWIAENPPRTFFEALQLTWFTHLLRWVESNGHSVTIGRLDQYLYPYYEKDIKEGRITREEALELIGCFFIKVGGIKKLRPWSETVYKGGLPTFQAITVGGQDSSGRDVTNELSYLILEATACLKIPEPVVIIRVHSETPDNFLLKGIEALLRHGGGLPSFFSDEAIIPALLNAGIPLNEARNYAMVACSEPAVPGKHVEHTGASTYINLPKLLELTLNGGKDPNTNICLCPDDKDLATFESFDEVIEAYKKQLRYHVKFIPLCADVIAQTFADLNPTPYTSGLLDYRIEIGKDMTEGGGPNSNNTLINLYGPPNVANSLAAIKKLVFEEKRISGKELKEALLTNFEGPRGEEIRKMLLRAPKYGNDDDYVDSIAEDISVLFVNELKKCGIPWRGGVYGASLQGLTANVPEGLVTGATPDGRKAGEALADNISPQAGTDVNGVTAMLKSVGKIDHSLYLNGTILNVKFHPTAVKGEGASKLAALIRTYLTDFKGWQIQFNIVSAEKLKEAQRKPAEYKDLIVKVAGYSAQFISLDKKLQDQIIFRTENVI
ncbi:formate C-acetyltransferase/glycerol dehydratase family glycyl radical enzyme [Candidatus Aerophobetes bacterium]|nr:formate C-acetyltransferase/glycerol dehydratase family glycyl radical enzyme [Candidatus Aerophobetes bacterium]